MNNGLLKSLNRVQEQTVHRNLQSVKYIIAGVTLFLRDHHAVSVTDAGRTYVEEARIAVLHADRAVQAARAAGHDTEMSLNVGRTPYADPFFTSTILATRLLLFPKLRLNLLSGFSRDLTHDVLTGELDAALVVEPPLSKLLTGLKVDESPFYVVMSREDELAHYPSINQTSSISW